MFRHCFAGFIIYNFNTVIDFTIVAFAVFWMVKVLSRLQRKEEAAPAAPPAPSAEVLVMPMLASVPMGLIGPHISVIMAGKCAVMKAS